MSEQKVYYCCSCGSPLNAELNREIIFCSYCGTKNVIESQSMKTHINLDGVEIEAKTDVESILASAEFAMSTKNYEKVSEMLNAAILSGVQDYRVYILKAKMELLTDYNKGLFESLSVLKNLEEKQKGREVTEAICELMHFRGMNGVTVLHNAAFHEIYSAVEYCVEHGSDVNCVAGMRSVTPISIMFVPISSSLSRLDGTPFVRNKENVKKIRKYLMSKGAKDGFRFGY